MDIPILFEDDAMLAVNKPPGIVVNNAQSVKGETIQDWAQKKLQLTPPAAVELGGESVQPQQINVETPEDPTLRVTTEKDFYDRAGIVHRIDKETSGILLIAKTFPAFVELQRQFKERIIKKTYMAIAHGKLVPEDGEIRAPVGRLPWNREHFGIVPGGKESVTKYHVLKQFELTHAKKKEQFSLVELFPETGRTHQIRVHLKYINHPILADYLYAGRKTSRDDRLWVSRVMLHAYKLVCIHPVSGNELAIEAPIPDDMSNVINKSANDKSAN